MVLLQARALCNFKSEKPGKISLWEHKVLSLCSNQETEGWFEDVNNRGDCSLFLHRFSTFMKLVGEAFVLSEALGFVKDGDKLCVVLGTYGLKCQENPYSFQCSIKDPTKQTKFKGMKSYIAYKLVPSYTGQQVHWCYKHFDWVYGYLVGKFPVISVPHLPEKQATRHFEEDFISKCCKGLAWWMGHMCSHPVLAQCDAFQHFLTCPSTDEKAYYKRSIL